MKEPKPTNSPIPESALANEKQIARILEITSEKQAEINNEQKRLQTLANSRARLNKREIQKVRGFELERHHRITGNKDALAEALAMQGKFREASQTAVRVDLKAEYAEFAEAVKMDDAPCGCDKQDVDGLPTEAVEKEVYSVKHGRNMPAVRCRQCGILNVRERPQKLARMQEARHEAVKKGFDVQKTFEALTK